jgi:hypothetical protein
VPVAAPVVVQPAALAPIISAPAPPRVVNPFLAQLSALLKKKEAVGTAIILREIFDRPLCNRGRR